MSPEYAMQGRFSDRSDVFSFGVLLLEIISGRRNTSFNHDEQYWCLLGYVSCFVLHFDITISAHKAPSSCFKFKFMLF